MSLNVSPPHFHMQFHQQTRPVNVDFMHSVSGRVTLIHHHITASACLALQDAAVGGKINANWCKAGKQ